MCSVKFARLENYPFIVSPYEMACLSSIFFKLCALHWLLRAWQFACARKIFSVHYILSSLGFLFLEYYAIHSNDEESFPLRAHMKLFCSIPSFTFVGFCYGITFTVTE